MLQDTNKRLQEYNTSLQQYNSNLQTDATKNGDTIAKLQKEKNTMVETMNGMKDHINSVKTQLDLTKVNVMVASLSSVLCCMSVFSSEYVENCSGAFVTDLMSPCSLCKPKL
jgi:predicted nuclease with TOPRIM domain